MIEGKNADGNFSPPEEPSEIHSENLEEIPQIPNVQPEDKRKLPPGELETRRNYLISLGFSDDWIAYAEKIQPSLWSVDKVTSQIQGLKDWGFANPIKMIESFPRILGHSLENIDAKIQGLKDRGFANPIKMIETLPTILGYSSENIDAKIQGLRDRGFANPIKMIETLPTILGYSLEKNIDAKIQGLRDRGFANPIKMIESFPGISSHSLENIDRRLRLFSRLVSLYQLPIVPQEAMETRPAAFFSTKFDKLIVLARILRDYEVPKDEVSSIMGQVIFINLENLLVALKNKKSGEDIKTLIKRARAVKKQGLSREEKRKLIAEDLESLRTERRKIIQRYFKGYPK